MTHRESADRHPSDSRWAGLAALCASLPIGADLRATLETAVRRAAQFFGADCGVVFLRSGGRLVPAAWVGLRRQLLPDLEDRPRHDLQAYMERLLQPRPCGRFLSTPMTSVRRNMGYLALCSVGESRPPFSDEDREMVGLLGQRLGSMIDMARLLEKAHDRQETLARLSAALAGEVDVDSIAEAAASLTAEELGADASVVWVASPDEQLLEILAFTGYSPEMVRPFSRLGVDAPVLAATAARTREAQQVESVDRLSEEHQLSNQVLTAGGMQSVLAVPLLAREQVVGVLGIARKQPHRWALEERALATTLGELLAAAILNARLHQDAERRQKELTDQLRRVNEQLVQANLHSSQMAAVAEQRAAELEATIANIADAVYVCDPEGKIILINSAGQEITGAKGAGKTKSLVDLMAAARPRYLDGRPIPRGRLAISRALGGEVVRGMEELIHDSRSRRDRYMLVSSAPVQDEKGNYLGVVEVQSDITRLRELDLLKDQFMTVAAHELKTPITTIKGYAQALLRVPDACAPKYVKPLETIVQQSDRIDALVKDFLEVSRLRWGRLELAVDRIDLTGLVSQVVSQFADVAAARGHRLKVTRKDPAWVEGDRRRLEEVLANLLENAVRYSPRGGEVEAQVRAEGDRVVVSVRDRGVGIPWERQPHVFERFYRAHIGTSLDYGGLGVGLYISREIVRRHGGEMWFESQEGKGSTFYFSLPLASAGS